MSEYETVDRFARALVRFNGHVLGATLALLAGAALFSATLTVVLWGGAGSGEILGQLHYFFPGYAISPSGACIGALVGLVEGALLGAALGALLAWLWNAYHRMFVALVVARERARQYRRELQEL